MDNRRIAAYLASGLQPVDVIKIVGCSASFLSELTKTTDFQMLLQEELDRPIEDEEKREEDNLSKKYLAKEHKLLDAIDGAIAQAELPAIVRALEVVGNRQFALKKLGQKPAEGNRTLNIINLQMPAHALKKPEFVLNTQSEVISIDGQSMAPMSSAAVKTLFGSLSGKDKSNIIEQDTDVLDELDFTQVEPNKENKEQKHATA